ncbi:MAG: phosphoribosylanthranilate isomerase [Euryarchaeota archaeon]|nr:phosphoribosylanthranilate isomerase [Euryarchaeota archaeon]MDE1837102.1 phosphoribosylanthranilate isomerase [Euryarchaeota archaeon]MDE1879686.1 phosphoribosylanthranilate isomerase [Euryarchaeota archaeon]MDE2045212.1 phosphoribosylanthranilate isomerase [Thermoplasmata archaeon]
MTRSQDRPLVKVCGLRTSRDLEAAEGADLIGVVVEVPGSPRSVSLREAEALFELARGRFDRVAVMWGPDATRIREVLRVAAPDLVQVHGPVPTGLKEEEVGKVVPSLAVPQATPRDAPAPVKVPDEGGYPFLHLDTAGGPLPGGTGQRSDWSLCRDLVVSHPTQRFLLGGGLTPENVAEAIERVQPHGVDVSSGVEERPGVKSREKVERFLRASLSATKRGRSARDA